MTQRPTTASSSRPFVRLRLAALASFVVALHAGPAHAQPRQPTHVACVGDSITAGTGATSKATNYPGDLQGLFGSAVQVQNFGHSGATLLSTGDTPYVKQAEYTAANSFVSGAGANAVVDVIIMLGTNDSKPANWNASGGGTQSAQFMKDCASLVDHFTGLSTHPVVYLALPLSAFTNKYTISGTVIKDDVIPVLTQVAAQKGLATIDLNGPTAAHPEYLTDGVHPNDNGYTIVAQIMHDGLLRVPQVSITTPSAGANIAGPELKVSASASGGNVPITSVQFLLGTMAIGTAMQAPFSVTWPSATPGSYALTAKATDQTGAATTSASVQISVGSGGSSSGGSSSSNGGAAGLGESGAGGTTAGGTGASGANTAGNGGNGDLSAGSGGAPASGGAGAAAGSAGTGIPASGSSGNGSAGGASTTSSPNNTSGCQCRMTQARSRAAANAGALLLLLALGLRRARRGASRKQI